MTHCFTEGVVLQLLVFSHPLTHQFTSLFFFVFIVYFFRQTTFILVINVSPLLLFSFLVSSWPDQIIFLFLLNSYSPLFPCCHFYLLYLLLFTCYYYFNFLSIHPLFQFYFVLLLRSNLLLVFPGSLCPLLFSFYSFYYCFSYSHFRVKCIKLNEQFEQFKKQPYSRGNILIYVHQIQSRSQEAVSLAQHKKGKQLALSEIQNMPTGTSKHPLDLTVIMLFNDQLLVFFHAIVTVQQGSYYLPERLSRLNCLQTACTAGAPTAHVPDK